MVCHYRVTFLAAWSHRSRSGLVETSRPRRPVLRKESTGTGRPGNCERGSEKSSEGVSELLDKLRTDSAYSLRFAFAAPKAFLFGASSPQYGIATLRLLFRLDRLECCRQARPCAGDKLRARCGREGTVCAHRSQRNARNGAFIRSILEQVGCDHRALAQLPTLSLVQDVASMLRRKSLQLSRGNYRT